MRNGQATKQTRQKRRKERIGIDYLKACYTYDKSLFDEIRNSTTDNISHGDFYLHRINESSDENTQVVNVIVTMPDGEDRQLGVLSLHNGNRYKGMAFFNVKNRALYTTGLLLLLPYVTDKLGLTFNNFTRIDIALTSTYNYVKAIQKSVRQYERIEMFYKGRRVADPEATLKNFLEIFPRSRKKRINQPTLVFGHRKREGIHCKAYDKRQELEEESPEKIGYTNEWLDFEYQNLYRVEVSLSNTEMRSLCAHAAEVGEKIQHGPAIIDAIQDEQFLSFLFKKALSSVLHFRHNGKCVEIWDL